RALVDSLSGGQRLGDGRGDRCLRAAARAGGGGGPAPRRVVERVGDDARIGLVVCGGNATVTDMAGWADRFGLR
ncbi:hypothetical protein ACFCX6_24025, partial [Streptomyces sp. NPDC056353]